MTQTSPEQSVSAIASVQKLPRWLSIGLAFPVIFLNLWLLYQLSQYFQPTTNTVLTAGLVAFLLDFPIGFLERRGMPRGGAIALVLLVALVLFGLISFILGPIVFQQLVEFANRLPSWVEQGKNQLLTLDERPFFQNLPVDLRGVADQLISQLSRSLRSLTTQAISLTVETINSALNLILTAVLTILLVVNGKRLWLGILGWFPENWQTKIQASLEQSFQGYFAGQATLALILSLALSLAFVFLGVPFSLLFGLGIGLASVIPFGGLVSILVVSLLVSFQNVWLGIKLLVMAIILGQINDNVVAPRLIGGITGLNPALVVVSLLVGVKLGGFLGLLIAVPTASFIKKMVDSLRGVERAEPNNLLL